MNLREDIIMGGGWLPLKEVIPKSLRDILTATLCESKRQKVGLWGRGRGEAGTFN